MNSILALLYLTGISVYDYYKQEVPDSATIVFFLLTFFGCWFEFYGFIDFKYFLLSVFGMFVILAISEDFGLNIGGGDIKALSVLSGMLGFYIAVPIFIVSFTGCIVYMNLKKVKYVPFMPFVFCGFILITMLGGI